MLIPGWCQGHVVLVVREELLTLLDVDQGLESRDAAKARVIRHHVLAVGGKGVVGLVSQTGLVPVQAGRLQGHVDKGAVVGVDPVHVDLVVAVGGAVLLAWIDPNPVVKCNDPVLGQVSGRRCITFRGFTLSLSLSLLPLGKETLTGPVDVGSLALDRDLLVRVRQESITSNAFRVGRTKGKRGVNLWI